MHQSLLPNCAYTVGPLVVNVEIDAETAKVVGYSRVYNKLDDSPKLMRLAFNIWDMKKEGESWKIARRESRVMGEDKAQDLLNTALDNYI